jgi:hypothetical protein
MNTDRIFLRRKREIGEILSDGFQFIRQNFKVIGKTLVRFVGPFFLLQVFMNSFYSYTTSEVLNGTEGGGFGGFEAIFAGLPLVAIIGLILTSILFYTMLNGTVLGIFESYLKNDGLIKIEDVGHSLKKNWPQLLGATFVIILFGGIVGSIITVPISLIGTGIGSAALILLFVFLAALAVLVFVAVPVSLVFPIMIFDKENVFQAIGDAYRYLAGNWLLTFLAFVVVYLISIVITSIFQLPLVIYMLVQQLSGGVGVVNPSAGSDWIMIILTTISQFFQYAISALIPIFTAFIYFNLHERKHKTGVYQEIDSIGSTENQTYN